MIEVRKQDTMQSCEGCGVSEEANLEEVEILLPETTRLIKINLCQTCREELAAQVD